MVITVPMVNNGRCISIKHGQGDFMRWTPLFIGLALAGSINTAFAAKVSKEQVLYNQIAQAVADYRQALAQFDEGDASKQAVMAKSLEDLEDLANQCFKMKSCSKTQVISAYEQLIKDNDFASANKSVALTPESLPALNTTVKLLGGGNMQLMTQFNEPVKAAIGNWLSGNRDFFMTSWVNYQYMRYLMAPEYEKAGLPEALLFGMMTKESGGKVHSVSKAGAAGPLQFMPSTGRRFGLDGSYGYDMRYDPQYAARANAEYMNERFDELNRSLEMAIAGYNGGEGRARRIHGEYGGANFWQSNVYNEWPAETRDYVPAVIAAAWLFMYGKEYGLTFPKLDFTPSSFALQRPASISELTICLGNPANQSTWFRVLRNLNPRYEPTQVIPQGTQLRAPKALVESYQANCSAGERAELARSLMLARKVPVFYAPEPRSATVASQSNEGQAISVAGIHDGKYTVKPGETLMMISRTFDCDLSRLIKENDLSPPDYVIRPGQEIKLIGCSK
jgi:membrane-bound lytic murein transglycosylase D